MLSQETMEGLEITGTVYMHTYMYSITGIDNSYSSSIVQTLPHGGIFVPSSPSSLLPEVIL